jgi:MoaA/NifB/PqqE/SkfB family radical SAM enzyme
MSKTFCVRPWIHQHISPNGSIRICCVAKEENIEFRAGHDDFKDSFNSETLKRMRKQMLDSKWPKECKQCEDEEAVGIDTARIHEIDQWKDSFTFNDAVNTTNIDGSVNYGPRYLDLRFGNFCNLKCRICGPANSHSLYEEWAEYFGEDGFQDWHGYVKFTRNDKGRLTTTEYDWHQSETFWNQLEQSIDNLEYIFMAGGEPFLIKRQEEFLRLCIDKGRADKIILAYNTNLSSIPEKLVELWKEFKQVRVGASIDGMGKVLEYQRYPLKWKTVLTNLQNLNDIGSKNSNMVGVITLTTTVYNVFQLPEFMWWKLYESDLYYINNMENFPLGETLIFPVIITHVLNTPSQLNIQILPKHIKDKIQDHYNIWINKFQGNQYAIEILKTTIDFMYADDQSQYLDEFVKFTKFLDQSRGQDLKESIPELSELI